MLPEDYVLVPTDSNLWREVEGDIGEADNPGSFDVRAAQDVFGGPEPAQAHIAFYWTGDDDERFDGQFLWGVAMVYRDIEAMREWLDGELLEECGDGPILVRGNRVAILDGNDEDLLAEVAQRIQAKTGAQDWCKQSIREGAMGASPLPAGRSGPYTLAVGDDMWFRLVHEGGRLAIELDGGNGDSVVSLYDQDLDLRAEDDDGGDDTWSRIDEDLPRGTYYLQVRGFDGDSLPEFHITWTV